jgi:hypothetical protein
VFVPRLGWKDLLILGKYLLGIPGNSKRRWTVAQGAEGYFDQVDSDLGAGWEEWIFRGEKGVWEVGGYIRAKCAIEITLDHCIESPLSKETNLHSVHNVAESKEGRWAVASTRCEDH